MTPAQNAGRPVVSVASRLTDREMVHDLTFDLAMGSLRVGFPARTEDMLHPVARSIAVKVSHKIPELLRKLDATASRPSPEGDAASEVKRLRDTNRDLHRRVQKAESKLVHCGRTYGLQWVLRERARWKSAETALAAAREVLKEVEWRGDKSFEGHNGDFHLCPSCDAYRVDGHTADCRLAATLADAPMKQGGAS